MRKEEPAITVYSVEDGGEEGMGTTKMVNQRVHKETVEKKDLVIKELEGFKETMEKKERIHTRTLEKKKNAVIEKREAVIKELQARVKSFEDTQEDEGGDKK